MPLNEKEKAGFEDLLVNEAHNMYILEQLAKSVTRNVIDIGSTQEALDYIFTHIGDAHSILLKKHITKEVLFKYLHHKLIPVTTNFTKKTLIDKIIAYWNQANLNELTQKNDEETVTVKNQQNLDNKTHLESENEYPINLFAKKFSEWFFNKYNESNFNNADFWADARLSLDIIANDRQEKHECNTSNDIIAMLLSSKNQFGFFFNPNLMHSGVQGRMDAHGLVLVLACGSLHTQDNCVGVFECIFGLLRDPFADNNWKIKQFQCVLRSQLTSRLPSLEESDTLKNALELPVPKEDIS